MSLSSTQHPSTLRRFVKHTGRALGLVFVLAAGGFIVRFVVEDPRLRVQDVVIAGNAQVSDVSVRHLSDIRSGQHLAMLDLDRAVRNLERHPAISDATFRRRFPGTIEIAVTEHRPEMLVALDGLWYVDDLGRPFSKAEDAALDLPVLTGLDPIFVDEQPERSAAIIWGARRVMAAAMDVAQLPLSVISEVHLDPSHGFELVLTGGARLIVGFDDPSRGLSRLPSMVDAGLNLDVSQVIDLGGNDVAVVTPRVVNQVPLAVAQGFRDAPNPLGGTQ